MLDLRVNEFLVAGVDQWHQEDDTGGEEGKAPGWKKLDKEIAEQSDEEGLWLSVEKSSTDDETAYRAGDDHILGQNNALHFNHEEVDQLFDVVHGGFESFLGNCVVFSRSNFSCRTGTDGQFGSQLGQCHDYQQSAGVCKLLTILAYLLVRSRYP